MSYNIDMVEIIARSDDFGATRAAIEEMDRLDGHSAECSVIDDQWFRLTRVEWCGEGSGTSYAKFKRALALCTGSADLLLTWEGGDSHDGLRISDGKVTEHEVEMSLGKERV